MAKRLTELPGVGSKTGENLRKAGYSSPNKIAEANPGRLAYKTDGIGEKTARKIINAAGGNVDPPQNQNQKNGRNEPEEYQQVYDQIESTPANQIEKDILDTGITNFTTGSIERPSEEAARSPFTTEISGPRKRSLSKIHNNRSERAQDVDEQQNAPITTDEEKWINNKDTLDYPGVDTIPANRRAARAETAARKAQEKGGVDRVEQKGNAKNLRGKFSPEGSSTYGADKDVVRVQNTADQPARTLAHEVGHALDHNVASGEGATFSERLLNDTTYSTTVINEPDVDDETLKEQAKSVSKKARGTFYQPGYRKSSKELGADFIGQAIINPQATKRDAPELFDRFEDLAEREGFDDVFSDPLSKDSERQNILDL